MQTPSIRWTGILIVLAVSGMVGGTWFAVAADGAAATTAPTNEQKSVGFGAAVAKAKVARGKYLATAGDCRACHTAPGGPSFAGGLPIKTPFGTVYSANITPDRQTGIGKWSDNDFYDALHEGHGPHGTLYYPVFPYAFFTKVTRQDTLAIKDYLFSLDPVHHERPHDKLNWPFNYQVLLNIWQALFLDEGTFRPDPTRSALYNRGAYLVQGLGHCGACHTPRNWLGATEPDRALTGARISGWNAPDISTDERSTIRDMSIDDVAQFLRTGAAEPRKSGDGPETAALGPMATVVHKSLSHLTDRDLTAIATYLKQGRGPEEHEHNRKQGKSALSEGEKVYLANCSACHGRDGEGRAPYIPALRRNPVVKLRSPLDVVHTILRGAPQSPDQRFSPNAAMPAFGGVLTDNEIAAVATYIRSHWRNSASGVGPSDVKALRR